MGRADEMLAVGARKFREKLDTGGLVPFEVPEWEATLYRPAAVSPYRANRILNAVKSGEIAGLVQTIIDIARDENGKPVFSDSHKDKLMKTQDNAVIIRVANELADALVEQTHEETVKNSETIPTSTDVTN